MYVEISKFFSSSSQTSILQDPTIMYLECFFVKFDTCIKNDNFGAFLVKHTQKLLGVKNFQILSCIQ